MFPLDVPSAKEPYWTNASQLWIKLGILNASFAQAVTNSWVMMASMRKMVQHIVKIVTLDNLHLNVVDVTFQ